MSPALVHILAIITAAVLICLVLVIYLRSLQGDRRVINLTNQVLLPILSILLILLNLIYSHYAASPVCTGASNILRYIGIGGTILLVLFGCIRFFLARNRDRRLLLQPVLLSVVLVTVVFLLEYLYGCLQLA
jgi:uncharacterized membrane protein